MRDLRGARGILIKTAEPINFTLTLQSALSRVVYLRPEEQMAVDPRARNTDEREFLRYRSIKRVLFITTGYTFSILIKFRENSV